MNFVDICAGIGGGRLGLERAGFNCIGYSEVDKKAINTYKTFFDEDNDGLGNIFEIDHNMLKDKTVDLVVAGFPCQSYSMAGLRGGLADPRGQVIFAINEFLKTYNVKYFIMENVRGLLSCNGGKDFEEILKLLGENYEVHHKLLNSKNFEVPHSRDRIYLVGIRKDLYKGKFLYPVGNLATPPLDKFLSFENEIEKDSQLWKNFEKYLQNKYNAGKYTMDSLFCDEIKIVDKRSSWLTQNFHWVNTLRKGRAGVCYTKDGKLYSLSASDALRLQGFPLAIIEKAKGLKKSIIIEQTGNAMTVDVIAAIAFKLQEYIRIKQ